MEHKKEFEELVLTVLREGGSDLHIGAGRVPAVRVFGELSFLVKHPVMSQDDMLAILALVLGREKLEQFREKKEIDFSYDFRGEARLRGNAFFQKGMITAAFRL